MLEWLAAHFPQPFGERGPCRELDMGRASLPEGLLRNTGQSRSFKSRGYTTHDFAAQMIIFETTFLTLAFANAFGHVLIASRARTMVQNPKAISVVNKAAEPAYRRRRRNSRGSSGHN